MAEAKSATVSATKDMLKETRLRNFPVIVENQKIWVSREILAEHSPVFEKMFFGQFSEGQTGVKEITLEDKKASEMVLFLERLHAPSFDPPVNFSWDNILSIYCLACEYQVLKLQELCLNTIDYEIRELDPMDLWICQILEVFTEEDLQSERLKDMVARVAHFVK